MYFPLFEPMKSLFLLVLILDLPFAKGLAFQHSAHHALLMCLARGAWKSQGLMLLVSIRRSKQPPLSRRMCVKSGLREVQPTTINEKLQNALEHSEGDSNSSLRDLVSLCEPTREERALNEREQECRRVLNSVVSFSCSGATGFAARCSACDTCFASDLNSSYASTYLGTIDFESFRAMSDKTGAIVHISWSTGAGAQSNGINQSSSDTKLWDFWGLSH